MIYYNYNYYKYINKNARLQNFSLFTQKNNNTQHSRWDHNFILKTTSVDGNNSCCILQNCKNSFCNKLVSELSCFSLWFELTMCLCSLNQVLSFGKTKIEKKHTFNLFSEGYGDQNVGNTKEFTVC